MTDTHLSVPSENEATNDAADRAARAFVGHRELLFSVVYNILASVTDTEDVLQETWVAWTTRFQAAHAEPIENPRAYLVRMAVNQALAKRAEMDRRRETYVGQWLPEPLLTPLAGDGDTSDAADGVIQAESLSMALLVVLETLSPVERAVFVLHEVFGYAHTEIADMLGRSPAGVRQLARRARDHVQARRPRYRADPRMQRLVTQQFLSAAFGGDLEALLNLLAPDVTLWTDGGGKGPATSLQPIHDPDTVARTLVAVAANAAGRVDVRHRAVNGDPSAVLFHSGSPFAVLVLDVAPDSGKVRGIFSVTNPDKLTRVDEFRV